MQSLEKASQYWRNSVARKSSDPSLQVSLQGRILHILRFTITGDLCNSWEVFGGLAAQLSRISIAPRLAVTEYASFAIARDVELRNSIRRMARRRDSAVDFGKFLSGENDEE